MNIFILDHHPYTAAQYLCDKHIPKMLLESAQMLSTVARLLTPEAECDTAGLYKSTHAKHPCVLWLLESPSNIAWLWHHMVEMNVEYRKRFKHIEDHKSMGPAIKATIILKHNAGFKIGVPFLYDGYTPFTQCMPIEYRIPNDPVTAYRNYYIGEKSSFAKWQRGTPQPEWFKLLCQA